METITNIIKTIIFWSLLVGALASGVLSYQFASYYTYSNCVKNYKTFRSTKYHYSFHNNIFYKIQKWINPSAYKKLNQYANIELRKQYEEKLATLNVVHKKIDTVHKKIDKDIAKISKPKD